MSDFQAVIFIIIVALMVSFCIVFNDPRNP
jgi:hypothetical protein